MYKMDSLDNQNNSLAPLINNIVVPGNTNQEQQKQTTSSRNFILTVNEKSIEHYDEIKDYLTNLKNMNYYLCCEHIGQENKHYHIFVQYENSKNLSFKKLHGCHVEKSYGSAQQNIKYVKAEDEKHIKLNIKSELIDEIGEPKLKGGCYSIKDIKNMTDDEIELSVPLSLSRIAQDIKSKQAYEINLDEWHKDVKIYYIYGPSGIGKSCKAKEILKKHGYKSTNIVKCENGFWQGIGQSKSCIYDDFRDSDLKAKEFIQFVDYNRQIMNVKGGTRINEYELIIITSIQNPYSIYKNMPEEAKTQWLRRIKIINLNPKNSDNELEPFGLTGDDNF